MATNPFARFALSTTKSSNSEADSSASDAKQLASACKTTVNHKKRKRSNENDAKPPPKAIKPQIPPSSSSHLAMLDAIIDARQHITAPIDQYGTQACIATSEMDAATRRFHILVAAMLSAQTKDQITYAAMQRLHAQLSPLSIANVMASNEEKLDKLLHPVGFHRRKASYLLEMARICHAHYANDIPQTLEELIKLPGVGPKIARVVLYLAWKNPSSGIIVDTHVHRLAKRFHWISHDREAKTPEDTRKALEEWVPPAYWGRFSRAIVGFGQTICLPVRPQCTTCPVAHLCPSVQRITRNS